MLARILKTTAPAFATRPTTTAAKGTLRSRSSLVDSYDAPVYLFAVERGDRSLSFCTGRHFHKGESPGAARIAIMDDGNLLYLTVGFERFA